MVLPDNQRPSFGPRAVKGIFVGYCHPYSLAYKILYAGKYITQDTFIFMKILQPLSMLTPPFPMTSSVSFNNFQLLLSIQQNFMMLSIQHLLIVLLHRAVTLTHRPLIYQSLESPNAPAVNPPLIYVPDSCHPSICRTKAFIRLLSLNLITMIIPLK